MRSSRGIAIALLASIAASLAVAVVYWRGGQPQLEGLLLGIALGGIAVGLALFAKAALPHDPVTEDRKVLFGGDAESGKGLEAFVAGAEPLQRRAFLRWLFGIALGALGLASLFPIRSLGTRPGRELFSTSWRAGLRLVTEDGLPIAAADLSEDTVITVFPEGHVDAADSQTILIKLPATAPAPGRAGYSVDGFVAFSKVCTHAGCPVGLYQADTRELFCPCHQSVFAVMEGARPTGGPATRPLPQLPLSIDESGYLVAQGDFPEPVGPGF
ncbi:MAG TPA: ubiquinol-cytochrome c reductase iron-sulfur subunit, partial [Actinomycetota bacterium]|nr:ubiquinol-cytochrome c reductase iron-sulfur subunit [Actinomycetota bacterium]